ncbi:MAG: TraR/DksA C4-type zinc finger protein [Patescibacteria group bacterium]
MANLFTFPARVLEPVRSLLTAELKKLKLRRKQIDEADPFKDESRINENSVEFDVDEQVGHARSEALKREIDKKIIQVRKALSRVKVGRYGICEKCGHFIDTKRLMIYPETTYCVDCTRKDD